MAKKPENPRKLRNYLLNPDIQLAFALNIVALSAFFVVGIAIVVYFQLGDFIQNILAIADFEAETLAELRRDWDATSLWLGFFMASYIVITIVMCIIYTHRMIGPTIAFKRQINDLNEGNYTSKIKLREGDAFQDVANLLNDLGSTLQNKHKSNEGTHHSSNEEKDLHNNAS